MPIDGESDSTLFPIPPHINPNHSLPSTRPDKLLVSCCICWRRTLMWCSNPNWSPNYPIYGRLWAGSRILTTGQRLRWEKTCYWMTWLVTQITLSPAAGRMYDSGQDCQLSARRGDLFRRPRPAELRFLRPAWAVWHNSIFEDIGKPSIIQSVTP